LIAPKKIELKETEALLLAAGGDARALLNIIDQLASTLPDGGAITDVSVKAVVHQKNTLYDKSGEGHYNIASALIKSIRGSDPDASLYWLARMLEGGEDPKFIARRLLILASEDIGNANPTALVMANTCFQSVSVIGLPESDLILSQTVIYLACSPKSNSAYTAIRKAQKFVKENPAYPVPLHLRNAPTQLMKKEGYGAGYLYPHHYPHNHVEQSYLPDEMKDVCFFEPQANPREAEMKKRLDFLKGGKK
jgi:putative ATPase